MATMMCDMSPPPHQSSWKSQRSWTMTFEIYQKLNDGGTQIGPHFTHWSQNKMAKILQMAFSNESDWKKSFVFLFKWMLFISVCNDEIDNNQH